MKSEADGPRRRPRLQPKFARAVYVIVRHVPRGTVVTYGQVAAILGHPRAARAVGTALARLPRSLASQVPWQRVINSAGKISYKGDFFRPEIQRRLLEAEGVRFSDGERVNLKKYRWAGPSREKRVRLKVEL